MNREDGSSAGKPTGETQELEVVKWTEKKAMMLNQALSDSDFCEKFTWSPDRPTCHALLSSAVRRLGFTDFAFLRPNVNGVFSGLSTLPPDLLWRHDRTAVSDELGLWSQLASGKYTEFASDLYMWAKNIDIPVRVPALDDSLVFFTKLQKYGYDDAYCIPVASIKYPGCRALFLVLSADDSGDRFAERIAEREQDLALLSTAIDYISAHFFPEFYNDLRMICEVPTTSSDEVVQAMVANGWTLHEVASAFYASVENVVEHLTEVAREGRNRLGDSGKILSDRDGSYRCEVVPIRETFTNNSKKSSKKSNKKKSRQNVSFLESFRRLLFFTSPFFLALFVKVFNSLFEFTT